VAYTFPFVIHVSSGVVLRARAGGAPTRACITMTVAIAERTNIIRLIIIVSIVLSAATIYL
jgi:hypothetical protein